MRWWKAEEARSMGAHDFVDSRDANALEAVANSFDMILSTVAVDLDWGVYINALRPKGRLHFVGVVPSAVSAHAFALIGGQKTISGSPVGSPEALRQMLEFAAHHGIEPVTETFAFSDVNAAMEHMASGQARYRVVLRH